MQNFPANEQQFIIPGPSGDLEILTAPPSQEIAIATAIICHPHSLHGGTMNNKVVTTLSQALRNLGMRTIRFNFRGVGKSMGTYSAGVGEVEDVLAIHTWIKNIFPEEKICLAGFSFGSYVAALATPKINPIQLISIAPPVENFNFKDLPQITCPWLIVQGDEDEIVSSTKVYEWIATLSTQPTVIRMPETGHFFHRKLIELRSLLETTLTNLNS